MTFRIISNDSTPEFDDAPHHTVAAFSDWKNGWYVLICNEAGDQLESHYEGIWTAKEAKASAIEHARNVGVNRVDLYKKYGGLKQTLTLKPTETER